MRKVILGCLVAGLAALPALAQGGGGQGSMQTDPMATTVRNNFHQMANNLIKSAQEFPDDKYTTKLGTQPETRTFAALIGHVINANYFYCSMAKGEKSPQTKDYEKEPGPKAEMAAAMQSAIDYCTPLYDSLTDANAMDKVTTQTARGSMEQAKIVPLLRNMVHNNEEYGNIVGYFRANNLVPPSSENQGRGGRRGE
jgi:uncharacterized damage-inducible protein DinB